MGTTTSTTTTTYTTLPRPINNPIYEQVLPCNVSWSNETNRCLMTYNRENPNTDLRDKCTDKATVDYYKCIYGRMDGHLSNTEKILINKLNQ